MSPGSSWRRRGGTALLFLCLLPLVPVAGQPGGGRSATPDSLFAGTPPADSLRPVRRVSTPDRPGVPFATTAVLGFVLAFGVSLTRNWSGSGYGRGNRDAVDAALTRLRRIQHESHVDDQVFCARLTSVLRSYLDDVGEEGWPPGRPVRAAVRRRDPLREELERWESVRFGGRQLDPDGRRRAVERLGAWLEDDGIDGAPERFDS